MKKLRILVLVSSSDLRHCAFWCARVGVPRLGSSRLLSQCPGTSRQDRQPEKCKDFDYQTKPVSTFSPKRTWLLYDFPTYGRLPSAPQCVLQQTCWRTDKYANVITKDRSKSHDQIRQKCRLIQSLRQKMFEIYGDGLFGNILQTFSPNSNYY